jgi:uncharacterized membrane protein
MLGPSRLATIGVLIAASAALYGPQGPLALAAVGSVLLVFGTLGVRVISTPAMPIDRTAYTAVGSIVVVHCHHAVHERHRHEFSIRGKFICAGCCGLAAGVLAGLIVAGLFAWGLLNLPPEWLALLVAVACCLPALHLIGADHPVSPQARALTYGLVPVAGWLALLQIHATYRSAVANALAVVAMVVTWECAARTYRRRRRMRAMSGHNRL